jgi:hypothetical protein
MKEKSSALSRVTVFTIHRHAGQSEEKQSSALFFSHLAFFTRKRSRETIDGKANMGKKQSRALFFFAFIF